ncbi:MAG: hypothetical protein KDD99_06190, partial [Bacteroidetes bacterium]|nr:hypothetical protein [Bacteroidota bacterium]
TITLGATYQLDSLQRLHLMLQAGISEFSLGSPLPLILIGYERNLGKYFTLGAHVYGGNLEKYGVGLYGQGKFDIAKKVRLNLFYSVDNGLGLISPENTNGFAMHGGATISLIQGKK